MLGAQALCAKELWMLKGDAVSETQPKVCLCSAEPSSYHLFGKRQQSKRIKFCFLYCLIWWLSNPRISKCLVCIYRAVIDSWWMLWSCKVNTDKPINFNCYLNSAAFRPSSRLSPAKLLSAAVLWRYRINPNSLFMGLVSWNWVSSKAIWFQCTFRVESSLF